MATERYLAFISYAHADNNQDGQRWADWLQGLIMRFEVPGELVGVEGDEGVIPRKMPEVFLDRRELRAGEFDEVIKQALESSRFLIVICSPRSAASEYVGKEIEHFNSLHGDGKILLVMVDGTHQAGDPDCGVPPKLFEIKERIDEDLPLFVDVRAFDSKLQKKLPGWTEPGLLANNRDLHDYAKAVRQGMIDVYERDHRDAEYRILATLLGVNPATLDREAQVEAVNKQRRKTLIAAGVALVMASLTVTAVVFAFMAKTERNRANEEAGRAETERNNAVIAQKSAERSLLMIGDAHAEATRLAGRLLTSLMSRESAAPDEGGIGELIAEGMGLVSSYFDDVLAAGPEQPEHMRSVYLNGKGRLYLQIGRHFAVRSESRARADEHFQVAEQNFRAALTIRKKLWEDHPSAGLYLHDLAVSYDNLGDLHAAKARVVSEEKKAADVSSALANYELGLASSRGLERLSDRPPNWRHDIAVSHFKIGELHLEVEDYERGREELTKGLMIAEESMRSNPAYTKWQAEVARFKVSIGKSFIKESRKEADRQVIIELDRKAVGPLKEAREILARLEEEKRLTTQQGRWLKETRALLTRLAYLDKISPGQ